MNRHTHKLKHKTTRDTIISVWKTTVHRVQWFQACWETIPKLRGRWLERTISANLEMCLGSSNSHVQLVKYKLFCPHPSATHTHGKVPTSSCTCLTKWLQTYANCDGFTTLIMSWKDFLAASRAATKGKPWHRRSTSWDENVLKYYMLPKCLSEQSLKVSEVSSLWVFASRYLCELDHQIVLGISVVIHFTCTSLFTPR